MNLFQINRSIKVAKEKGDLKSIAMFEKARIDFLNKYFDGKQ